LNWSEQMLYKNILVTRDVEVKMRDGVILRADVYRPDTPDSIPVLLQRTPYGKYWSNISFAMTAVERGYAVVIQDTRGRWNSEGDGYAFIHEKNDGFDTVEWVASQPWAEDKVGMFGASYVGYTQYAAAVTHPPALRTIVPSISFTNPYSIFFIGGAFTLGVSVSWALMAQVLMEILQSEEDEGAKNLLWAQLIDAVDGMSLGKTFEHLPLEDIPMLGREGLSTLVADVTSHPTFDEYWQRILSPHAEINIPVLQIGGWYDIFITDTLQDYSAFKSEGLAPVKMLIGPWVHETSMDATVGEVDFGLKASAHLVLPEELHLRWFDYWLKGIENGVMDEEPIRIFTMGENRWRNENEWPPERTQVKKYYLHSGGSANTLNGNGSLSLMEPSNEPVDNYVYDPHNPVPTHGGGLCCWRAALPPGAFDQREVETRPDVLVYTSAPLEHDLEVTGMVEVHLWASTSAPDTDFTAKLVDVEPSGFARNLCDGIIRARYRNQNGESAPLEPGELYEYVILLGATSNLFKAGHRIRLEISSSNFPRFNRNPNTRGPILEEGELRTAAQSVFHEVNHPSHVLLPIIPRG
jgi:putative CocE/NonD family hydrolase